MKSSKEAIEAAEKWDERSPKMKLRLAEIIQTAIDAAVEERDNYIDRLELQIKSYVAESRPTQVVITQDELDEDTPA